MNRSVRRGLVVGLIWAGAVAASVSSASAVGFRAEVGGMFAIIPETGGKAARMIMVNALNGGGSGHAMPHMPLLVIQDCGALADANDETACRNKSGGWSFDAEHGTKPVRSLASGYDIVLLDGNGAEVVSTLKFDSGVAPATVKMKKFGAEVAKPILNGKVTDAAALLDLAVGRIALRAGELRVASFDQHAGDWTFVTKKGKVVHKMSKVARTLDWDVPVTGATATIELRPYAGGQPLRIKLRPYPAGGAIQVAFQNDPSIDDFCMGEPGPWDPVYEHFERYFDLAASASAERALPRYEGNTKLCKETGEFTGWPPRICQKTMFAEASQDW